MQAKQRSKERTGQRTNQRTNQPAKQRRSRIASVRWTVQSAASEFGINPRTVASRLKVAGIVSGQDGLFSTVDIHRAICGDIDRERLRETREKANKLELENAVSRGELMDLQDLARRYEPIYAQIRQTIIASTLSDNDKDALLTALANLHTISGRSEAEGPEVVRQPAGDTGAAAKAQRVAVGRTVPVRRQRG